MPSQTLHDQVLRAYILHLTLRDALIPPEDLPLTELLLRLQADMEMYRAIKNTRYLNTRTSIPKSGSLHLAWEYARRPEHHDLGLGERREGHAARERMEIHAQSFLIRMLDDYCHKSGAYPKDSWPHMMFVSQALLLGPYIEAPEVPHHQQDPLLHQSEGVCNGYTVTG